MEIANLEMYEFWKSEFCTKVSNLSETKFWNHRIFFEKKPNFENINFDNIQRNS